LVTDLVDRVTDGDTGVNIGNYFTRWRVGLHSHIKGKTIDMWMLD